MASLIGYSQELVTNGDFESATTGAWFGNAFNIVTQGSNNLNQANVTSAGAPFDVNLSQVIDLQDGLTYELNFDAFTDTNTGTRTIIAGLGQNGGDFTSLTEQPTLTSTPQTFTFQFTVNYGDNVDDRVLFDMGAETGFVFIDDVSVIEVTTTCNNGVQDGDETGVDCGGSICPPCVNPPSGPPTTPPARDPSSVLSVYSDAYTQAPTDGFQTFGGAVVTEIDLSGNGIQQVTTPVTGSGLQYQYFGVTPQFLDLSAMTNMHIDFYFEGNPSAPGTILIVIAQYSDGTNIQENFDVTALAPNTWHENDIPFADFDANSGNPRDEIQQVIVQVAGADGSITGPFYIDNLYFHDNTTIGTEDFTSNNFSTYPNPTSDSWTITSQNENIKTVEIFNTLGRLVKSFAVNDQYTQINASDLSSGIYFAKVSGGNNQVKTLKLIKK
ncbi:T9SS type A sorting domain-containing protein [Mesohalobacter halotolerans]|uniref:T9SS type A sorting domain-containing protein n=1 Tax=Mesohalobacter halotolerans TaxID=1883405 RepID=UPI00148707D6|nr:T9SS type A sorting domain-containing protein [Mesohalobacter halotolerans]